MRFTIIRKSRTDDESSSLPAVAPKCSACHLFASRGADCFLLYLLSSHQVLSFDLPVADCFVFDLLSSSLMVVFAVDLVCADCLLSPRVSPNKNALSTNFRRAACFTFHVLLSPLIKVFSFDLVSPNPRVTACDMAHVPLKDASVHLAIFCLSLMGTNLADFLREAHRVLVTGGLVKVR